MLAGAHSLARTRERSAIPAHARVPLILDLVRHGKAEPSSPEGDSGRRLTAGGAVALRDLGRRVVAAGLIPTRVFSSPLVRARESARILTAIVAPAVEPEILEELSLDVQPADVIGALAERGVSVGHAMLVGHMPQLGELHLLLTDTSLPFDVASLRRIAFSEALEPHRGRVVSLPDS